MTAPLEFPSEPARGFRLRQLLPTLVFDLALPVIVFNLLTRHGVETLWALAAGGMFPAINNLRLWIASRRIEPLGVIVIGFLLIGTAVSLLTHSVFIGLIKASFLTAIFGLVCLGSLVAERPLMFYVTRQFVAGDDPARLEWWNGLWQFSGFRNAQRLVTAVWGIAYLVEAVLRVLFALSLSPAQVVVVSPVIGLATIVALVAWTRHHLLAVRERRLRELHPTPPIEPAA